MSDLAAAHARARPRKKPMTHRFLVVALALAAPTARAATWTAQDAREHVLADDRFVELIEAAGDAERASGRAALPHNNPFLGAQHEQSFGDGWTGTTEEFVWVGQTFDLSFRRPLLEEAGERRARAAALSGEARRREALLAFERRFYAALAAQNRTRALDRWVERLDELARRTRVREQQGDASRYDVLRIERELVLARRERARADLARAAALEVVAGWLDDNPETIEVTGELAPETASAAAAAPRPLPALALDAEVEALAREHEAADRWYLPPVTATAGGKTILGNPGSTQTPEVGPLLILQVPLPVFERGDARRAELRAAQRLASARAELLSRAAARRAAAARATWERALAALRTHEEEVAARSEGLVKTARAAWGGGELSLLALLEAERTTLDDELAAIELGALARDAQLTWTALTMEAPR